MLEFIEGTLVAVQPTYIVVNANGMGYRIQCANSYYWQNYLKETVMLFIELVVREDAMTLYGFKDLVEKQLFLKLNTVSNIGPKSAMSILALEDHNGLVQAIESENVKYIMKFPGVGKKTAQQIILDLKGKLGFVSGDRTLNNEPVEAKSNEDELRFEEISEALTGLGYSKREINAIEEPLKAQSFNTTQEALSYAFKLLVK